MPDNEAHTVCAACGTENRLGSRFCDTCGSPLASSCPACGEPNRSDARFCAGCGSTLAAATPQQPPLRADPATAERRLVTIVFTDLVGFTALAEDRDPEAVRELLSRYFDTATEIVRQHGGTVEKFIGDAVMAVWGTPVAHEDDAERAVRAALELVDAVQSLHADLQARAGVLTGEAAVTIGATNQGMVAGDLVNTAARLQGVAEPGTVLVGEATRRAAERAIVFEPIGDHSLKGKTSPVPAWQALRVVAQRGGQGRADSLEAPFVGRDEELRQLKDVLHAVGRERRPRLVSVTGPGGIGKSRLVWELEKYVDGVAEPIYWHRGRSPSYGEGITFWALGEMVRRRAQLTEDDDVATTRQRIAATLDEYVNDASERERIGPALLSLLGVDDAPEGGRDALFPAWRLFFERIAERGTTALVFEDLHWADTGLLDFIDHLLDWSRGLPIMVVTLARPELFDKRPDWGVGRRHLTAMALEPLTDAAVREMLAGLVPGLPEDALAAIVGRAEGVPLYAVETVRGLLAEGRIERQGEVYAPVGDLSRITVPDSLRSLIASRLDALDPGDRGLLQDAAVLGQVFSTDALAAVHGTDRAELEPRLRDLVRRELLDIERDPLSPERGQHKFVQSLIREVAYGTLARRDRRARHLAVARHYEGIGDEELAGALASHYVAAHEASDEGPEADAIATQARLALTGAADRAAALGAHQQAVIHLEQALTITTEARDRAPLLDRAARAAGAAALPDAKRHAEDAVHAYREVGDPRAAADAVARLGRVLLDASEVLQAIEVLRAAIPSAESLDDPAPLAAIWATLSRAYMRNGESERSIEAAERALPVAEAARLDMVIAEAFVNKGSSLRRIGRMREALALLAAAVEMAKRGPDRGFEIRARNNYASILSDDDPVAGTQMVEEVMNLARDVGDRGMYTWLLGNQTASAWSEGRDWDRYIDELTEAYELSTLQADRVRLHTFLTLMHCARGERVDELLTANDDLVGDDPDIDNLFSKHMVRAEAALARGDPGAAFDAAFAAGQLHSQSPEIPAMVMLRSAVVGRDADRIRRAAREVADLPAGGAWTVVQRKEAAAALAAIDGRAAEASSGFVAVHAGLTDLGQHYEAAQSVIHALTLMPDASALRALAEAARPMLETLRARPLIDTLDAALAAGIVAASSSGVGHAAEVPAD